jgi:hypothetical protein
VGDERVMSVGKIMAGIAACIMLVFFLTPWVQVGGLEASGFDLARSPASGIVETMLLLTPLAAFGILVIIFIALNREPDFARTASGVIVILAVLAVGPLVVVLVRPEAARQYFGMADLTGLVWQFGFWCTLAAGLFAVVGGLMDVMSPAEQAELPLPPEPLPPLPQAPVRPRSEPTEATTPASVPPLPQQPTKVLNQLAPVPGWVVVTAPAHFKGQQWQLKETMTLGRDGRLCDIVLDDQSVSRTHATIKLMGRQFYIFDMGSLNKTKINGITVQRRLLYDRDVIALGNVSLLFMRA